jgi:ligand-binding SRPBCC domain-containing protein
MIFDHRFRVKAPLSEVASFHRLAGSMSAITPPPLRVQIQDAPTILSAGDEMDFSLQLGPFHLRWIARIEDMSAVSFTDRQLRGPFQEWNHRHSFHQVNENITEVSDQISAQLKKSFSGRLLGWGLWLGLPFLFAFRAWKTRALLEKSVDETQ